MGEKKVKKITLGGVLSWIFGMIFVLSGFGSFISSSFVAGITLLIMGAVLLPPMNEIFKEKMNFELSRGIKIAIIIIGFIIVGMTANTDTTSTTTANSQNVANNQINTQVETQKETQVKEPETPKETIYSMNQDIDVDYLRYKVTKVETFTEMGTSMFKKETKGKFVKVYLDILNNAKETKYIFSPRFYIIDNQGRKYDQLSDDMMYIANYIEFGQDLQPGLSVSGAIVFELPKDSTDLKLVISGDWISLSQVKVALTSIKDIGKDTTLKDKQDAMMDEVMADAQKQMDELMQQYS